MSDIGNLIDEALRDWLIPPDDQLVSFTLANPLTNDLTDTTLIVDLTLLPPEVTSALTPGQTVELGQEIVTIGIISGNEISNCIRATNGTPLSAHEAGTRGYISPPYSRFGLFEAASDAIVTLYPSLYRVKSSQVITANEPVDLPEDFISPLSVTITRNNAVLTPNVSFLQHYPPSSTNKAIIFHATESGLTVDLTYRANFTSPESEASTLTSLGLEREWKRIVIVDMVAQMIAGRDLEGYAAERLMQRMEAESFPPISATRIHTSLIRYHEYLLTRASRRLLARDGVTIISNNRYGGRWGGRH